MAKSLLLKSPTNFAGNSRPPLTRDPMIRPGSKFLFDFTDPRCHPGGVITPGAVAAGTQFTSLDNTPVTASVVAGGGGTGLSINADGSLEFAGVSGGALRIGAVGQFNMSAAPYECAYGLYLKFPASGYDTTNYQPLLLNGQNGNNSQIYIDTGVGGLTPRAQWGGSGTGLGSNPVPGAVAAGAIVEHAVRVDPGVNFQEYRNGASVSAGLGVPSATATDQSAQYMRVGGGSAKFTCYRVFLNDIDASLAQETTWGFADADKLTAAQQVLRDYQFCTNALSAAPKTPFA